MSKKKKILKQIYIIGLSFAEQTGHIVAWSAPAGMKKVNITLVDNLYGRSTTNLGTFG